MTSKQRAYLRSISNSIEPLFMVGKSSLTPEFNEAVNEAFNTHELIKLSVLKNCPDDPKELAVTIAERTRSEVVQVIGKKFILYKPFPENPVIILPKAGKTE
ncbi:MAG: YhbY family RNA-binding protein [Lachnospiraceae bacterium]|nr:YhbY family RNA-binding protein [Lachnospiraceae bacterium]